MRIFIAQLLTESNTFSPIPTGRPAYEELGVHHGDATTVDPDGVFAVLTRWRRLAEVDGHQVIEGLAAQAQPGGRTVRTVYEAFRDEILAQLSAAGPVDAILLNLHGAMSAEGYDDCEGDLLQRIRSQAGAAPAIGVELDLHCHLTKKMVESADIMICYKHYPHTDIGERSDEVYRLTVATAEGLIRPVISAADCALVGLWHTTREPMRDYVRRLYSLETGNVLNVSLGHGFPYGDVVDSGARVWVITDDDAASGDRLALALARELHGLRREIATPLLTIDAMLDEVERSDFAPIVAADGADNPGGGAPSDSTFILRAMIERSFENALIAFVFDPQIVHLARQVGIGSVLDVRLGGKTGPASGDPVDLRVEVRAILPDHVQRGLGLVWPLGTAVWLRGPNDLDIVVTSVRSQPFDPDSIRALGIRLEEKRLIVLKSIQHFHALFSPVVEGRVLYVAAPGALTSDFVNISYVNRPPDYWPRNEHALPRLLWSNSRGAEND